MSDSKNYTRDDEFSGRQSSGVARELQKLLKQGSTNDYRVLSQLRAKHKDTDFVDAVFEAWKDRQNYILRKARKFKQLIFDRYRVRQLAPDVLMRKAKKYQKKLNLNDDEFNMFLNLLYVEKSPISDLMALPTTKMSKTLGFSPSVMAASERLNVSAKDEGVVQKILQTYAKTRTLHSQVVLQALTYSDCDPNALLGKFDEQKHNSYSYIHPVLAALFIPRINLLDEQMLYANIGYIVKCKKEGMPIMTKPDFNLYHSLIRDPNDNACGMESAIADLHNRYYLQTRLWDCVLNLRQGRYYADNLGEFMTAIDNCRSNVYDSPDLTYVKDEGTILRRLLSAFSLRPTVVSTTRMYNPVSQNPYGFATDAMSLMGIGNVTSVPMITLRLPLSIGAGATQAVHLQESMSQPQWFVENNMIVPKSQQIIHSRDVLFFYVNRRYKSINVSRVNTPCNFNTLPMTVAGWEALNDMVVNFDFTITVLNDSYDLRSVVVVDRSAARRNLIVGSSAMIVTRPDMDGANGRSGFLVYDPQGAGTMYDDKDQTKPSTYKRPSPVSYIEGTPGYGQTNDQDTFTSRASRQGTIFMYQKQTVNRGVLNCGC